MFERFTQRARRVLVLAQEEARILDHNFIGTEHILLGLVAEGEGVGAVALRDLGVGLDAVRAQVQRNIGSGPMMGEKPNKKGVQPPFTARSKKVLELSLREALQLGHNYIGTEHILLGLIQEGEGVGARTLDQLGVSLGDVRRKVIDLLRGYKPAAPTPAASAAVTAVLEVARQRAAGEALTTGHVLAAIAADPTSQAAKALASLQITPAQIETALQSIDLAATSEGPPVSATVEITVGDTTTVISDPEIALDLIRVDQADLKQLLRDMRTRGEGSGFNRPLGN